MWAARAAGQAGAPDVPDAPAPMVTHPNGVTTPYVQPSQEQKLDNYWNEAFGPNPMLATVFVAGWHQWRRVPPEWREGMAGYGERYGSDFASSVINMSTRYALARVFDEDTMYYRCACKGLGRRLRHSVVASIFVHQGADGHRAFALPAVAAPYAASFAEVYGWYPRRYDAEDAFRMGSYGVLWYVTWNVSLEFLSPILHAKRTSWIERLHFDNRHLAPETEKGP